MMPLILVLLLLWTGLAWPTAYHFSSTTARVSATSNPTGSDVSTFSAGCWTRRSGDGAGGFGRIMQPSNLPGQRGWAWFWESPSYRLQFGSSGNIAQWTITSPIPALNTWAHLLFTVDLSSDINATPTIYVNGVAASISQAQVGSGSHVVNALTDSFVIGNRVNADRGWDGQIGSCAWYDRVLSAGEVRQVMTCGPQTVRRGLIWYGPLGHFGGRDYSDTAHTALTPTSVSVTSGPPVSCAQGGWFND